MNPEALARRLRAEMARFVRGLARARRGDAGGVHRARVASRRLREALPIGALAEPARSERLRRELRRLADTLGSVRELDVALGVLEEQSSGSSWPGPVVARIREHLTRERERRARRMHDRISRAHPDRLAERVDALALDLASAPRASRLDEMLALTLRQRARRLTRAIDAAGTLYVPEALHRVRIAGKKLRYSLELARDTAGLPVGRDVGTLRRLQGLLGRLHDLQVLQAHIQVVAAAEAPNRAVTRALEAIAERCEADCRDLQAGFLRMSRAAVGVAIRAGAARADDFSRTDSRRLKMARIHPAAAVRLKRVRGA